MKKTIKSIVIASGFIFGLQGCVSTSSNVKKNAGYEFPISVTQKEPAFIYPVSLHGVPGNRTEIGLAITGGVAAKNGTSVISGQPFYTTVGNLSWTLGENIRRQANKGEFTLTGSANKVASDLKKSMDKLTKSMKKTGLLSNLNYSFKHVIVLHVDVSAGMNIPGVDTVTAFGGIIDLEKMEIISYIEKDLNLIDDHDTILGQMPVEMNIIVDELLGKK
jgi:hypothetical protein